GIFMHFILSPQQGELRRDVRWRNPWTRNQKVAPRSISTPNARFTHCNGVLIAGASDLEYYGSYLLPEPSVYINFPRPRGIDLNVARQSTKAKMPNWEA